MRKRGHVINAVVLGVGIGVILEPSLTEATARSVVAVGVPVTLGALLPDVDTAFGDHRVHGHNALVLGSLVAFPIVFGNLAWVWLGVGTHYVLDLLGNVRGMTVMYPLSRDFYDVPVGVPVDSRWADLVTVCVTGLEVAIAAGLFALYRDENVGLPGEVATLLGHLV
jgi:membrane-bound metal-dependent hydrolase YbcI (DUF457 family)